MFINGKEYVFEIRTEEENKYFLELLEDAEDKLNQALGEITYSSFKNLNTDLIKRVKDIIGNISVMKNEISSNMIYKPIAKS